METRANLMIVGVFVLAVIVAGFGAVSWLLGGTRMTNREEVTVVFPGSVTGLAPGAAVTFNGIRIGEVARLANPPDDPTSVLVIVSVDRNAPIKVDSKVSLSYSGLTGLAGVQIQGGTKQATSLFAVGSRREMHADAGSVQDLMEGAKQVMGKADATLTEINNLVRENGPSISRTLKNAEAFSDALAKNSGNIERFMGDVGKAADVLAKVSGKAEGLIDDARGLVQAVDPAQVKATVSNFAKISADMARSSSDIDAIVAQTKQAVADIGKFSASAGEAVTDVRRIVGAVDPAKVKTTIDSAADFSQYLSGKTKDVDDIVARAKSASANIDSFTGNLAARNADMDVIFDDAKKISSRLEQASQRVDGILAKIDGVVGSGEAQGLFSEARAFFASATDAAKSIRVMADTFNAKAGDVADGINRLTATGAREIKDLVTDGRRTLNSIDRTVNDLDRNPSRLIFGGSGGKIQDYGPGRR